MKRRIVPAAGLVVAAVLTLSACTPPTAEPTAWQSRVETVAAQAFGGDYAAALATLDALEVEVTARRDAAELAADEAEAILSRIATVRADLTSLTPTPAPEPVQTSEPVQQQPTVPEEDDDVDPGDQGSGDGPSDQAPGGNGNGTGNGNNGNGKDGGGGGPGKKDG